MVPGVVHTALMASGDLPDVRVGEEERHQLWVGDTVWIYEREFEVGADLAGAPVLELVAEGLDTLATVELDGVELGRTANMFRTWTWDLSGRLEAGTHRLRITFAAVPPVLAEREQERTLYQWNTYFHYAGRGWVRKMACNFGWDWGPAAATAGIWRDIYLRASPGQRLAAVTHEQDHVGDTVHLTVWPEVVGEAVGEGTLAVALVRDGRVVAEADGVAVGEAVFLEVEHPELWWPAGLGAQALYELRTTLTDAAGRTIDLVTQRIGLRTLRLVRQPDAWGESFYFEANGVPFFAKGANWIPVDPWPNGEGDARERSLLQAAAAASMNMIRAWGGGIYPTETFYDTCDELGLCVWQDFMFACGTYPAHLPEWREDVEAEARDQVRRLAHRASLALWCGNNELEQGLVGPEYTDRTMPWTDYAAVFDHLLARVVAEEDGRTAYWPGSPHTPAGDRTKFNDHRSGDAHLWNVWFQPVPFEDYLNCPHRFNSEFGFQSFPDARTALTFAGAEQLDPSSRAMSYRQRSHIGNGMIVRHLLEWFRMPAAGSDFFRYSQITQALAIRTGVEHWRRLRPRSMGALYWQLNDNWAAPTWSSIDSFGRWKALHHDARRFFAPVALSAVAGGDPAVVEVWLSNDRRTPTTGTLRWQWTNAAGEPQGQGELATTVPALASANLLAVPRPAGARVTIPGIEPPEPADALLWLTWTSTEDGTEYLHLAERPRRLSLRDPELTITATPNTNGPWTIVVQAPTAPALWVWLEEPIDGPEVTLSEQYFHLPKGGSKTITATGPAGAIAALQARSVR